MDKSCSILIGIVILLTVSYAILKCYEHYKKVTYKNNYKKYIYRKVKRYGYKYAFDEIRDMVCTQGLSHSLINLAPKYNHFLLLDCVSFMFLLIDSGFVLHETRCEAVRNILNPMLCSILKNDKASFEDVNIQINKYRVLSISSSGVYSTEIELKNEIHGNTFTVKLDDTYNLENYEFLFDETRVMASDYTITPYAIKEVKKTGAWQNV